jgi:hypothetical protein
MQLPDNITARTRELATRITEGLDNPYDMAQAITTYLRTSLEYSETLPAKPAGQEPVDWVLFDQQQAFCNYYATAEIVMLRSLGIPARMAVGYAEGERVPSDPQIVPTLGAGDNVPQEFGALSESYLVRHRDAHAWPEVYFPTTGWVEFEPTASQLAIFRPEGNLDEENESESDALSQEEEMQRNLQSLREELFAQERDGLGNIFTDQGLIVPRIILYLFAVTILFAAGFFVRRMRQVRGSPPIPVSLESGLQRFGLKSPEFLSRWVYYATLSPLAKAYLELNRALKRLGNAPKPKDTPGERAEKLRQLLPVAGGPIQILLTEYQAATYGPFSGDSQAARSASLEVRNLSFLAMLKRFLSRFQEPRRARRASIFKS